MSVTAVVTAAGYGTRLGLAVPKALVPVGSRPLLVWALDHLAPVVDAIVVTAPADHLAATREAVAQAYRAAAPVIVIAGGHTRQESVAAAVEHIFAGGGQTPDVIAVHDAARAFMPTSVIAAAIAAVQGGADAAVPVVPVVDTLVEHRPDTLGPVVDRDALRAVQTPQVFKAAVLRDAHARADTPVATDDASLARQAGYGVVAVDGHRWGFKVTHPEDLAFAEHLVTQRDQGAQ